MGIIETLRRFGQPARKELPQNTIYSYKEWRKRNPQKAQQVQEENDQLQKAVRQELIDCKIDPDSREGKKLFQFKMGMIARDASWLG